MKASLGILLRAVLLAVLGSACALAFNALRPSGLPWIADRPYAIYKPCPLMSAAAAPVEVGALGEEPGGLVFVDARPRAEHAMGRIPGARSLPYDTLAPADPAAVRELKKLGPNRIVVYGDRAIDSGKLLASELAEAGCLGVRYLEGGFEAWRAAGRPVDSAEEGR